MSNDKDIPKYLDPSFLRGLTQARFSRRTALKGAGALSAAGFLAACGIGAKTSISTASKSTAIVASSVAAHQCQHLVAQHLDRREVRGLDVQAQ